MNVEIARGTPHGRDRERWGTGRGGRDRSPRDRRDSRDGRRPVWLDKYGPPTRTDYKVVVENLSSRVSWQVRRFSKTQPVHGKLTLVIASRKKFSKKTTHFLLLHMVRKDVSRLVSNITTSRFYLN